MINSEYIPVALPILLDYLLVVSCDFNPVYYLLQHHFTVQGTVDICTPYPEYVLTEVQSKPFLLTISLQQKMVGKNQ